MNPTQVIEVGEHDKVLVFPAHRLDAESGHAARAVIDKEQIVLVGLHEAVIVVVRGGHR